MACRSKSVAAWARERMTASAVGAFFRGRLKSRPLLLSTTRGLSATCTTKSTWKVSCPQQQQDWLHAAA